MLWAIGILGQEAARFVEATDPLNVLAQMFPGEIIAPVTEQQKLDGVIMLGDMTVGPVPPVGEEQADG